MLRGLQVTLRGCACSDVCRVVIEEGRGRVAPTELAAVLAAGHICTSSIEGKYVPRLSPTRRPRLQSPCHQGYTWGCTRGCTRGYTRGYSRGPLKRVSTSVACPSCCRPSAQCSVPQRRVPGSDRTANSRIAPGAISDQGSLRTLHVCVPSLESSSELSGVIHGPFTITVHREQRAKKPPAQYHIRVSRVRQDSHVRTQVSVDCTLFIQLRYGVSCLML